MFISSRLSRIALGLTLWLPHAALAQSVCNDVLARLQPIAAAAEVPALLATWKDIEASDCDPRQILAARSQTSAFIAQVAQDSLDAGDAAGAEALIKQAPGVHWAVQALRGDLAAKRGDRGEAAKMYNAAIDTIGDPQQTVQNEALVPVAEQLAALAQENMMLAGSMESSVTRGGGSSGVMAMASRGLSVEKINAAPKATDAYVAPADPAPDYQAPAADYQPPADDYNVVTAAAAHVNSVFLPIRFGFDSDRLDAAGTKEALRLSEFIKANNVGTLIITGHTDDVGDANYNLDLSARRAKSLADFLLSDGVDARITLIGKGESEPPAYSDATVYSIEELRTIARRVEVAFGY